MTSNLEVDRLIGCTAIDSDGNKVGKVGQVYLDDQTGQPSWVTVTTGLFGNRQSFAPLYGATPQGNNLALTVTKDMIKDAPNVADDGHIEQDEQRALYDYYAGHLGTGSGIVTSGTETGAEDTAVRTGSGEAMTRSEERVNVGTQRVEAGKARLRKYVVTENVTQTVPVSREEVRVEREPITEANRDAAVSGPDISEAEHEVTLHEERPVVEKETVPVERVRLGTETVTDQQTVDETVRKERIDTEGVDTEGDTGPSRRSR
jgi:uncharacterized protein (TIGR02271 family)